MELSTSQLKTLKEEEDPKVQAIKVKRQNNREKSAKQQQSNSPSSKPVICENCGFELPHKSRDNQCPAKGKQCNKCQKYNHFAKVCRSKSTQQQVNVVEDESDTDSDSLLIGTVNETGLFETLLF